MSRPAQPRLARILLDGAPVEMPAGVPVAAGLLAAGLAAGGLCFMGTCHQCVARVDGRPQVRLCRTPAAEGMVVER